MFKISSFFLIVSFTLCICAKSQMPDTLPAEIDSMITTLNYLRDNEKVDALNSISQQYINFYMAPKNALPYAVSALELSRQLKYSKGEIQSRINVGIAYTQLQDYVSAKKNLLISLDLSRQLNYQEGIVYSLTNLISLYREQSNYKEALECFTEALQRSDEENNKLLHARSHFEWGRVLIQQAEYSAAAEIFVEVSKISDSTGNGTLKMLSLTNLAIIYNALNDYEKSLAYYLESYNVHKQFAKGPSVMHLNNIGYTYYLKNNYPLSLTYTKQALKEAKKGKNNYAIAVCLGNLGYTYFRLKNYSLAFHYFDKAMTIHKSINSDDGIIDILHGYSELYLQLNKYYNAITTGREALLIIQRSGMKSRALDSYRILYQAYAGIRNFKKSYQYQSLYTSLKDSLFNKENSQRIEILQQNYGLEKKQSQIDLLAKTNELQEIKIKKQNTIKWILLCGLVIIAISALMIILAYRQKHKINIKLIKINGDIIEITKKLNRTKHNLNSALSSGLVGVLVTDLTKKKIHLDENSSRMIGVPFNPDGISFDEFQQIVHPEDRQRVTDSEKEAIQRKTDYDIEYRVLHPSGKTMWLFVRGRVDYDKNDTPITFSGAMIDITDRKNAQQHKSDFLSIVNHEIRTPLTSVKLYMQIAERMLQHEHPAYSSVSKAQTQIHRLERLTADLMDVSSIAAGEMLYEYTEFDFNQAVNELVDNMQLAVTKHKIILERSDALIVKADRYRIEQVVNNLLNNAIKYSPGANCIIVKIDHIDENIIFSVQDFGIGIPEESIGKLNERFYRVKSDLNKYQGLGLGLYIAAEIIKYHSGRLWVKSEPGKGSIFYFSLPFDKELQNSKKTFSM